MELNGHGENTCSPETRRGENTAAMKQATRLDKMLDTGLFHFQRLEVGGLDNTPVLKINDPKMAEEEICLFHRDVPSGDAYCRMLHEAVFAGIDRRKGLPVVRFADGEYAFYRQTLGCNGLYNQAKSIPDIRKALPFHIRDLNSLAASGKLAPLIFPGNIHPPKRRPLSFFRRREDAPAVHFIDFLYGNRIELTGDNYIPFYVVYAYLVSELFAKAMDKLKICIVNSEFNLHSFQEWFNRFSSHPSPRFVQIPDSYMATDWPLIRERILGKIPHDIDLFLVGAGVGALSICVDLATRFSVPAIDAGHVLNMMNGREDKSNGPRLFTVRV